eukprot:7577717-Pyramimonas_sp.AAC.1
MKRLGCTQEAQATAPRPSARSGETGSGSRPCRCSVTWLRQSWSRMSSAIVPGSARAGKASSGSGP